MIEIIPNFHPAFVHFPIAFITAALAFTAMHGTELVYRHGLGVMALPDTHEAQDAAPHDAGGHHDHAH